MQGWVGSLPCTKTELNALQSRVEATKISLYACYIYIYLGKKACLNSVLVLLLVNLTGRDLCQEKEGCVHSSEVC